MRIERSQNGNDDQSHPILSAIKEALDWETTWRDRIDKIDTRYGQTERTRAKTLSVFWSIIEVLRAATYQRVPELVATPRNGNTTPILRAAADVVEGAVATVIDDSLDPQVRLARDEWLRHGRGVLWVETAEIAVVHVPNLDFTLDFRARSWRDVQWIARRQWWTREAARERWPEAKLPFEGDREEAAVWEHWDKATGLVTLIADDANEPLEQGPPAVNFPNFFPVAQPIGGMVEPGTLIPVPDVLQYQDQLDEVDKMTARIADLSESLRLRGFYPAGDGDLGEAVERAMRTTSNREVLIPVRNFQSLGGHNLNQSVVWLPIEQVVHTIQALIEVRRQTIEDIYQVTGVSDILRGAETDEERTATEVGKRAAWGSQRVKERQLELARGVRDTLKLVLEAMVETIDDPMAWNALATTDLPTEAEVAQAIQQLQQVAMANQQLVAAGQPPMPQPQLNVDPQAVPIERAMEAIQQRRLLLDIETESTVYAVEQEERAERMQFVSAVAQLAMGVAQAAQMSPALAKFGVRLIEFASAGYRIGRDFQSAIDELEQALAAQPGDSGQQGAAEEVNAYQQKTQLAVQRMGAEAQIEQATGAQIDGGLV